MISFPRRSYSGIIDAIPSKSMLHRALISAFLSKEECTVSGYYPSDDVRATLSCLESLGIISRVQGKDLTLLPCKDIPSHAEFHVKESGSTLRFLIPLSMVLLDSSIFHMEGRLASRPLDVYEKIASDQDISFIREGNELKIKGKLKPGVFHIDSSISSQFLSGLLFALPLLDQDSILICEGDISSLDYVRMTMDVLSDFGILIDFDETRKEFHIPSNQKYHCPHYSIEGDYSQAAFYFCAGCISKSEIEIRNLDPDSLQADKRIIEILKELGADIKKKDTGYVVYPSQLSCKEIDIDPCPDLGPALMALGCYCKGGLRLKGIRRLALKESDRFEAMQDNLSKLGITVDKLNENECYIHEGKIKETAEILKSYHDHRIFMALAMLTQDIAITIDDESCLNKSYPTFMVDEEMLRHTYD